MKIATIRVSGVSATPEIHSSITAGMRGATVSFDYTDPMWNGLVKNVTFQGVKEKTILNAGETVAIPSDTVSEPNQLLMVGVVGVEPGENVVIPTIWAELGVIRSGTYVSEDSPEGDSSAPIWIQQQSMIGDLRTLLTGVKSSLVAAINWMVEKGIGTPEIGENGNWFIGGEDTGVSARGEQGPQGVSGVYVGSGEMPEGYNVQIDPEGEATPIVLTVNGKAPDENGNVDIEIPDAYSKQEIDAIMGAYINDIDTLLGGDA